ncbi:MAG: sarcosine oxidase subunit gamma, partial [Albidovulum sp.]
MASLIEISACEGLLPKIAGGMVLSELPFARVTSVAPFRGKLRALGAALKEMGLGWPGPGQSRYSGAAAILWSGMDQAFLIGADPAPLQGLAALTEQSDGWARMRLKGP